MIQIVKEREPQALTDYKHKGNNSYESFPEKEVIRDQLIKEQHGLCAYCMSRISNVKEYKDSILYEHCKIEHFKPQSKYPGEQLNYKNLLGCCNGNEGKPFKFQTCDTHKGDNDLLFNPADLSDYNKMNIKFHKDGTIHSGNVVFDKQLDEVLNLNTYELKSSRKAVLDAAFNILNKKVGQRSNSEINKLISKYSAIKDGKHKEFYYVVVYYLHKHLH